MWYTTYFVQGWLPLSHPSARAFFSLKLARLGRPDSVTHLSFHAILQPASITATGPAQIHHSPNSISRTHPRFIGTALAGLGAVWAMEPFTQGRAPFRLEAVLPGHCCWTELGNPAQKFSILFLPSFARAQATTRPTKLAISARTHELPSLHSVTWLKARPSIGCHRAKALLFPSWAPGDTFPETLTVYGTVSCRKYSSLDLVLPCCTSESSENQQSSFASPSTPLQHTPTSLFPCGAFNANITGSTFPSDQTAPTYRRTSDPAQKEFV